MKIPFDYTHVSGAAVPTVRLTDGTGWWKILNVTQTNDSIKLIMTADAYDTRYFEGLRDKLKYNGRYLRNFIEIINDYHSWHSGYDKRFTPLYSHWTDVSTTPYFDAEFSDMEIFGLHAPHVVRNYPAHWRDPNCRVLAILTFTSESLTRPIIKVPIESFDI